MIQPGASAKATKNKTLRKIENRKLHCVTANKKEKATKTLDAQRVVWKFKWEGIYNMEERSFQMW